MKIDAPNIEQLTAIKGRKIPNELYNDGEYLSSNISTNWTIVAIVAIYAIYDKKVKFTVARAPIPVHDNAPSDNKNSLINQIGEIKKELKEAEKLKIESKNLLSDYENKIDKSKKETQDIINLAKKNSEKIDLTHIILKIHQNKADLNKCFSPYFLL